MQFSKVTCFAYKTYPLRERLALELDRKTREQFSRMRFGFFVNKRTDVKLVVARGSSLKFQQTCSWIEKKRAVSLAEISEW